MFLGRMYIEGYTLEKLVKEGMLPKKLVKRRKEAIEILKKIGLKKYSISTLSLQKNRMTIAYDYVARVSGSGCAIGDDPRNYNVRECNSKVRLYIKKKLARTKYSNTKIETGNNVTIEW